MISAVRYCLPKNFNAFALGKRTPGIDGKANLNDTERLQLVEELQGKSQNWKHSEVIRIFVPKKNGDKRPLVFPR
jgi:RNA-directed DNA polymerase